MKFVVWATVIVVLFPFTSTLAATYQLSDEIVGPTFYTAFEWEAIADPTHGRVYATRTAIINPTSVTGDWWWDIFQNLCQRERVSKSKLDIRFVWYLYLTNWFSNCFECRRPRTEFHPHSVNEYIHHPCCCVSTYDPYSASNLWLINVALMFVTCLKDVGEWS